MVWQTLLLFVAFSSCASNSIASEPIPRGVSRSKGSFYKPGVPFTCLDGSLSIPFEQINDDYCDCADGTDEPGTAACRNGKFYCMNLGYKPEIIPSSRVSDGVCDCCDGSDEYEHKVDCQNTCIEMGKSMREELEAQRRLIEEGHQIRAEYSQQGKQAKAEKQGLLVTLGPDRDALKQRRDELEAKKLAAEEPEKAAKGLHEDWWKEQQKLREAEKEKVIAMDVFKQLDTNGDEHVTLTELQAREEFDTNSDGQVSEEEITILVGEAIDSSDSEHFATTVWPKIKDSYRMPSPEGVDPIESPPVEPVPSPTEELDEHDGEDDDDDDADFDEDDFDEEGDEGGDDQESSSSADDVMMPPYPDETRQLMDIADAARKEFTDADNEFNNVDRQIQDIEKFLALDLGPDDVFYPLRDECYEFTDREYTYKFCPFEKATQRPKTGGSETNLGTFTKWEANGDDTYGFMKFEKGVHCWNGPDRSANVKFICGKENQLSNAAEPNRCEYSFDFTTPAACHSLPDVHDDAHWHTEL
ncbi:glucosidase 2 subunit beta-like [Watersipora subatra]|uniref:glucosidase 2 subunit beta-like n=1 Tax=Watersipora subatra TaxID=2589382 RepID=UPI00355B030B